MFDVGALLLAYAGCVAALYWGMGFADRSHGALWPQILATSVGYAVFLAVLVAAFFLRRRLLAPL
jgi:predicted membrane protein